MLSAPDLDKVIPGLSTRPSHHIYYRATLYAFAKDPLGKKRPINNQRFNVQGGARILYLGDDQVTCLLEAQALGFPANAITLLPVRFDLKSVINLTDAKIKRQLATTDAELAFNFRSLPKGSPPAATQDLGERCAATKRIDGILYKSPARPGYHCLAVIEAALLSLGSSLEVNDPKAGIFDSLP